MNFQCCFIYKVYKMLPLRPSVVSRLLGIYDWRNVYFITAGDRKRIFTMLYSGII
jgi:hypothetical protein